MCVCVAGVRGLVCVFLLWMFFWLWSLSLGGWFVFCMIRLFFFRSFVAFMGHDLLFFMYFFNIILVALK